jgi:hypothetical protein
MNFSRKTLYIAQIISIFLYEEMIEMIEQSVENFILSELLYKNRMPEELSDNGYIISDVVEGWSQKKYITPSHEIKFNYQNNKKYTIM